MTETVNSFPAGYHPDGPTANKVRAMISEAATPYLQGVCMALAHEIDRLREQVESEARDLDRHINADWRHRR